MEILHTHSLVVPDALAQAALVGKIPGLLSTVRPLQVVDTQRNGQRLRLGIPSTHFHDSLHGPFDELLEDAGSQAASAGVDRSFERFTCCLFESNKDGFIVGRDVSHIGSLRHPAAAQSSLL